MNVNSRAIRPIRGEYLQKVPQFFLPEHAHRSTVHRKFRFSLGIGEPNENYGWNGSHGSGELAGGTLHTSQRWNRGAEVT